MEGGFEWSVNKMQILPIHCTKEHCHDKHFLAFYICGVHWRRSAKTAEPIEMLFGLRTRLGPGNYVLDGDSDPAWEGAILRGKGASHCKV